VTPFVALVAVLTTAPSRISASTSRTRSNAGRKRARARSALPTTASRVLPTEIASATGTDAPLVAFAMNAATRIAGHSRRPKRISDASAIPVGAHTGVITPCATESASPSFAAPT
jgi:hypothetical protein